MMKIAMTALLLCAVNAQAAKHMHEPNCQAEYDRERAASQRVRTDGGEAAKNEEAQATMAIFACEQKADAPAPGPSEEAKQRWRDDAAKVREEIRQREQTKRDADAAAADAAKARAEADAIDAKIAANHRLMSAIFGAGFCLLADARKGALTEIATQKKYARLGGVQNNLSLLQLQNRIRQIDEKIASDRADMKGRKGVTALGCGTKEVRTLLGCKATPIEECAPILRAIEMITDPDDLGEDDGQ